LISADLDQLLQGGADDPNAETSGPRVTDITLLNATNATSDEFYQTVAVNSLVSVLSDSSLKEHHYQAIEAVMLIFRTQRLRCVAFLPQIIPAFLGVIRMSQERSHETYLKQLANLITIVKQHIRNYLGQVFALIHEFWDQPSTPHTTIIQLVEAVARAVEGEFKAYLPKLLQQILRMFDGDLSSRNLTSPRLSTLLHILKAFTVFGSSIEDYLHLILPVIVRSFENPFAPEGLRKCALQTIGQLCKYVNFADHASQIIHPLVRTLGSSEGDLRATAMETLCTLVLHLGPDYAIFIPMVNKVSR
jgi:FKBP12-rapamycin complex-associated protein